VRNELFGDPTFESAKAEVEDRIRRAQLAILNPSKSAKDFLTAGEDHEFGDPEMSFSKDCVSLDIRGPDVADLSFCDLPGGSFIKWPFLTLDVSSIFIGLIANVGGNRK